MTNITAAMVKDLRDKTGAGMMDCKAALGETGGDMTAIDWLHKKGISKADRKAGRNARSRRFWSVSPCRAMPARWWK